MLGHFGDDVRSGSRAHAFTHENGPVDLQIHFFREVPPDMYVTLHTLVYSSNKAEIDELQKIGQQIVSLYGKEFAKQAEMDPKSINDTIRENINLVMPEEGWKVARLMELAREEGLQYTPTEKSLIVTMTGYTIGVQKL